MEAARQARLHPLEKLKLTILGLSLIPISLGLLGLQKQAIIDSFHQKTRTQTASLTEKFTTHRVIYPETETLPQNMRGFFVNMSYLYLDPEVYWSNYIDQARELKAGRARIMIGNEFQPDTFKLITDPENSYNEEVLDRIALFSKWLNQGAVTDQETMHLAVDFGDAYFLGNGAFIGNISYGRAEITSPYNMSKDKAGYRNFFTDEALKNAYKARMKRIVEGLRARGVDNISNWSVINEPLPELIGEDGEEILTQWYEEMVSYLRNDLKVTEPVVTGLRYPWHIKYQEVEGLSANTMNIYVPIIEPWQLENYLKLHKENLIVHEFGTPDEIFGQAQTTAQIVKAWNFDSSNEGWKGRHTRDLRNRNGNLEVRIGQTFFTPLIFNRNVLVPLPLQLKYFSINLAIQKRREFNLPANIRSTVPVEPLTNQDIQVLSLPEQTASPSATDQAFACTADVQTCSDGTFVPRVPPNCEFLPCPERPSPFFSFDLHLKLRGSPFWSKPIPITGKISPELHEYTVKLPMFNPVTVEALKIEFRGGIGRGDIIQIDSIKLLNDRFIPPTRVPTRTVVGCNAPCSPDGAACSPGLECISQIRPHDATDSAETTVVDPSGMPAPPFLCRNPQNPASSTCTVDTTPTRTPSCVPQPPCAYGGITDEAGNRLYCDPPPGVAWCPRLDPTIVVDPCTPRPACAEGIMSPEGHKMFCYPPAGTFWCPKPSPTSIPVSITSTPVPSPTEEVISPTSTPTPAVNPT